MKLARPDSLACIALALGLCLCVCLCGLCSLHISHALIHTHHTHTHGVCDCVRVPKCARAHADDPPWCYFEQGSLKFNPGGTNVGPCTLYDECLCLGSAPPSAPPLPPSPPPPTVPPQRLERTSILVTSGHTFCHETAGTGAFADATCIWDGRDRYDAHERCEITALVAVQVTATFYHVECAQPPRARAHRRARRVQHAALLC